MGIPFSIKNKRELNEKQFVNKTRSSKLSFVRLQKEVSIPPFNKLK